MTLRILETLLLEKRVEFPYLAGKLICLQSFYNWCNGHFNSNNKGILKKPQSRADKIKAELKLLEWHKLANDSAIKVTSHTITIAI